MDDDIHALYRSARAALATQGEARPFSVLHLGDSRTTLAVGSGPQPSAQLVLAIGSLKTASDFFHHTPPTPGEIENAIQQVEDEVSRARTLVAGHAELCSADPAIHAMAALAGSSGPVLSVDAVERLFDLLAALSQGRPAASAGIPNTTTFAASLLILRELMHHLGFGSIRLLDA